MSGLDRNAIGRWLLDNADKQGSEEFNLMSKAWDSTTPAAASADESPGAFSEVRRGFAIPFQSLAGAISGDPAMRGIDVPTGAEDTLPSRTGEIAAEAFMLATPMGAAASRVKTAEQGAGAIRKALQDTVANIGQSYRQTPGRFIGAETALGAASGAGGYAAEQLFPDSDAARFIGEIAGGVAPAATGAAARGTVAGTGWVMRKLPLSGTAMRTWDEVVKSVKPDVAYDRAFSRMQLGMGGFTPRQVIERMDEEFIPGARELMTPAQLAGIPGLLSLERSIIDSADSFKNKSVEQLAGLNDLIVGSLTRGSTDPARAAAQATRDDYYDLLNAQVAIAARAADDTIERMLPQAGAAAANRIARRELEKALDASVLQEKELFNKIIGNTPVISANAQNQYRKIVIEMGQAGKNDIPPEATRLFGRKGSLAGETTVQEMRTAQSIFRGRARAARVGAAPNYNQARLYDSMANAITDDFAQIGGGQAADVANAVNFSRQKNDVFGQGQVGKILRGAADSGDVVPEALTLSRTLGLNGPEGAQAFDDILDAVGFATVNADYRTYENMASVMEDFVKTEFMRSAVRDGVVDLGAAQTFIRNNEETLRRLPSLAAEIADAAQAGTALQAQQALRRAGLKTFDHPSTSKAALLMNKGPDAAFSSVFTSQAPTLEMRKLVDMMGADPTEEALEGLRAGFYGYLLDRSTRNGVVSGEILSSFLGTPKNKAALSQLLSQEEITNLGIIARTAQRADMARGAGLSVEGVISDDLSQFSETVLRLSGGIFGREISQMLGGRSLVIPAVASAQFKKLGLAGIVNPAKRLVIDSMLDPEKFRNIILNSFMLGRPLNRRGTELMDAWAYNTLAREGLSAKEQEEEQQ